MAGGPDDVQTGEETAGTAGAAPAPRRRSGARSGGRAGNAARRGPAAIHQSPWRLPENPDPPVEPLDEDGVQAIHATAMRILEEIGIAILNPEALGIFRKAGCRIEDDVVFIDREIDRKSVV